MPDKKESALATQLGKVDETLKRVGATVTTSNLGNEELLAEENSRANGIEEA